METAIDIMELAEENFTHLSSFELILIDNGYSRNPRSYTSSMIDKYKTDSMSEMFQTMIQPIADVNLRIYIKTVIDPTPNTRC